MLDSTQFPSNSSTNTTTNQIKLIQSCDNSLVHTPIPLKHKTCIFKSTPINTSVKPPVASRSYNKLDEFAKHKTNYPSSPFKTERKVNKFLEDDCDDKMVKSDQLFTNRQAKIKELRNETKNPLGKEAFFPEKSFENLKFVRDSQIFELKKWNFDENTNDYDLKDDLFEQISLDILNDFNL